MKLAHIKTGVLAFLVALSMLLSYVLWRGNWQNSSGVSFTVGQNFSTVKSPQVGDVAVPYQMIFTSAENPRLNTIVMPATPLYAEWMRRLTHATITGWRQVPSSSQRPTGTSVEFDFGDNLQSGDVAQQLPNLATNAVAGNVRRVILYVSGASTKSVYLRYDTENATYEAETNLNVARFTHDVATLVRQSPWKLWNTATNHFVPARDTTAQAFEVTVSSPSIVPLVHSFFVNPQALTRVQEGNGTVLWTDGSQVVWWSSAQQTLTYADPNVSKTTQSAQPDVSAAVDFMRNHGGARPNTVLYVNDNAGSPTSFTLRTYINGLPILGSNQEYQVQVQNGKVVQYKRPLLDIGARISATTVKVIGIEELTEALKTVVPKDTPWKLQHSVSVELGYSMRVNPGQDSASLTPMYFVTEGGTLLALVDAQTGKVSKGMNER
jgi:regulatory protein YycH of two-component signal transduction system YycFG